MLYFVTRTNVERRSVPLNARLADLTADAVPAHTKSCDSINALFRNQVIQ